MPKFAKRVKDIYLKAIMNPWVVLCLIVVFLIVGVCIGLSAEKLIKVKLGYSIGAIVIATVAFFGGIFGLLKNVYALEISEHQLEKIKSTQRENTKEPADKLFPDFSLERFMDEDDRAIHWWFEKQKIAYEFVHFLEERVKKIEDKNKWTKIIILFDAGSTITPILEELGKNAKNNQEYWIKKSSISIFTSNLDGVLSLLKYKDEANGVDRHANIPFSCSVLPGDVLSAYAATASSETIESILRLKGNSEKSYVISISTGNYIFADTRKNKIIPIARTGQHPEIKAALSTISDEVYYIAPLGKVLQCRDRETVGELKIRFNNAMGYSEEESKLSKHPYKLISECDFPACQNDEEWSKKSILVTTKREYSQSYFSKHSQAVGGNAVLREMTPDVSIPPEKGPYKCVYSYALIETEEMFEIPHKNLREQAKEFLTV